MLDHTHYKTELAHVDNIMASSLMLGNEPLIQELAGYILRLGGKRVRPLLLIMSARLCGYQGHAHHHLAAAVELLHTATLLHDDVVDGSEKRRGELCAHKHWGNKASVLVGDFLLSRAFQMIVQVGDSPIVQIFAQGAVQMAQGEVMQLASSYDTHLTLARYTEIIMSKTAILFAASCETGAILAGADPCVVQLFRQFGLQIGILFQMIDDLFDYKTPETWGKNAGDDFLEGKITLPFILALKQADATQQMALTQALKDRTPENFQNVLAIIHATNAFHRAQEHISYLLGEAERLVSELSERLPESRRCSQELMSVVEFCAHRTH